MINCTTMNWFSEWPEDALQNVAERFLMDVDIDEDLRSPCKIVLEQMHTTINAFAAKFCRNLKRHYYATPTSFLELINSFKRLIKEKKETLKE